MNFDKIMSIVTGAVIPVLVAVFSGYIAEYFAKKRDRKQKLIEIHIEYMRKEIEYLSQMEQEIFLVSRQLDSLLNMYNPKERDERANLLRGELSSLNIKNNISFYMLECYDKVTDTEIDIEEYKKTIGDYCDNLNKILKKYIYESVIEKSNKEIDNELQKTKEQIENAIRLITDKMIYYLKDM